MSVSCNMEEESAKGRGIRRKDSKGKSQGNKERMNNTKGMWGQLKLEDRGQVTSDLTAKQLRIGDFIWKATERLQPFNKRKT